jgi:hypothetical protein
LFTKIIFEKSTFYLKSTQWQAAYSVI